MEDTRLRAQATTLLVSAHGGHSAQFGDAGDSSLEEMINAYGQKGFAWVGITEHIPPLSKEFLNREETYLGHTVETRLARFAEYFPTARDLQRRYQASLQVLVGFETEAYTGYQKHVESLRDQFQPDYVVGSVHHVGDICIDGTPEDYNKAVRRAGGVDELFCEYFDLQYDLIQRLRPEVVGHFDLVRIHDPDYRARLDKPAIKNRIRRNLEKIGELGGILDYNVRAYDKGGTEPYVSRSILEMALDLRVPCVPGDDSHGVSGVGKHLEKGIQLLVEAGFNTNWPIPGIHGT